MKTNGREDITRSEDPLEGYRKELRVSIETVCAEFRSANRTQDQSIEGLVKAVERLSRAQQEVQEIWEPLRQAAKGMEDLKKVLREFRDLKKSVKKELADIRGRLSNPAATVLPSIDNSSGDGDVLCGLCGVTVPGGERHSCSTTREEP